MAKKNPYVFTIGFDETNPSHARVAEILNGTKKKASLIANAVLSYVDGVDSVQASEFSLEMFQPFLEKMIQKELEKAMKSQSLSEVHGENLEKQSEQILDLSPEGELPMDESLTRNIVDAMGVFRRN
ncbi:hypothetical protein C808_02536 [Lachnospiraceae bacterium M18-1]|nr:hypothetical protein C808_02536 [Lachnospiraceae bacterium M18-1]